MPGLTSSQRNNVKSDVTSTQGYYKQGQLNNLWQGTLASPDRPSLLYGHGITPLKALTTGLGRVITEKPPPLKINTSGCVIFESEPQQQQQHYGGMTALVNVACGGMWWLVVACGGMWWLVVTVSWCGQESIMAVGRLLCMRLEHLRGIRYRDEILQHHVVPHTTVECFSVKRPDHVLHLLVSSIFNTTRKDALNTQHSIPQRPDITLTCLFAGTHRPRHFPHFLRHCSTSGRTFHNVLCNV